MAGNVVQQFTDDTGTGARLGPLRAESMGIGPSISYSTKWGNTPVSFAAKWERDFVAIKTFGGDLVVAQMTVAF